MSNRDTSALVDGILRVAALGIVVSVGLAAPNAIQALDKPLNKLFNHLDKNSRIRETKNAIRYMKRQGLIRGDYEHGLQITDKGRNRLAKNDCKLPINIPKVWDKKWRVVLYDIPEKDKLGRNALNLQLKEFGFWQLQKSVWVYPYACRVEIERTTSYYRVDKYVTYIEVSYIDNQLTLIDKFKARNIM